MKNLMSVSLTLFVFLVGLTVLPQVVRAQQQEDQTFQGQLLSVDSDNQTLTVADADNMRMTFAYDSETSVEGGETNVQGLADRAGAQVQVTYVPGEGALPRPIARRIVILPE